MAGAGAEAQDQRVREERVRGGSASAWPSPHSSRFSHGLNVGSELSLWTLPPGDGVGAEAGDVLLIPSPSSPPSSSTCFT